MIKKRGKKEKIEKCFDLQLTWRKTRTWRNKRIQCSNGDFTLNELKIFKCSLKENKRPDPNKVSP